MAKRRIEDELEAIASLRCTEARETAIPALTRALQDKVNLIVAKAASVAGDLGLSSLVPDMLTAYERLFKDPVKADPQCWGKSAIAKALKTLGYAEGAPFLRGVRYRQMEPVWGGEADSAGALRGTCALALVQCTDIPALEILSRLVDAVADSALPVRQDAIQGLAQWASPEAVLLLRLKARLGDEDVAVTGNIFDVLLRLEQTAAVDFVGSFLDSPKEGLQEEAALALGSSKLEAAVQVLAQRWQTRRAAGPFEVWIRAFGASRLASAFTCLIDIVRKGQRKEASAALTALQSRRLSREGWAELAAAVSSRHDEALDSLFENEFPRPEEA